MQIADQFRDLTAFLFHDSPDANGFDVRKPTGTGFFIQVSEDNSENIYLVTARHIVYDCQQDQHPLYFRVNTFEGEYKEVETDPNDSNSWFMHPSTDVTVYDATAAVERLMREGCRIRAIPVEWLATDEYVKKKDVSAGDEVFYISLFKGHPGSQRIHPVVRFGHIALMPDEKIEIEIASQKYARADAYLIDTVSMRGTSGSPVFVFFPPDRTGRLQLSDMPYSIGSLSKSDDVEYRLLGLIQGHYPDQISINKRGDSIAVDSGIAIVVPASAISEVLTQARSLREDKRFE